MSLTESINKGYIRFSSIVKKHKCKTCYGTGQQDDAELGDISFNIWTCTKCGGSGFEDVQAMKKDVMALVEEISDET